MSETCQTCQTPLTLVFGMHMCMRCQREKSFVQHSQDLLRRMKEAAAEKRETHPGLNWCPTCYAAPTVHFNNGRWRVACCGGCVIEDGYRDALKAWNGGKIYERERFAN